MIYCALGINVEFGMFCQASAAARPIVHLHDAYIVLQCMDIFFAATSLKYISQRKYACYHYIYSYIVN